MFNQIDRYRETDRDQIYEKIRDERIRNLIRPEDVVMTAARPDLLQGEAPTSRRHDDHPVGASSLVIEPLKLRILDVLEREGKALVASTRFSLREISTRRSSRTSFGFETTRRTA